MWTVSEKLRVKIANEEPDDGGWITAHVVEVPGAISQGRTRAEARENVIDALRLMLAPDEHDANITAWWSEQLDLTLGG